MNGSNEQKKPQCDDGREEERRGLTTHQVIILFVVLCMAMASNGL